MKTTITKKMMLVLGILWGGVNYAYGAAGDEIKVSTIEGVKMTFTVLNETEKTCRVGDGTNPCIDPSTTGTVTIPEEVMGYTVTQIYSRAFKDCSIKEVVIPQTVSTIWGYAFQNCINLNECWLPESLTVLAEYVFSGCSSLEYVYLPHQLTEISKMAFDSCTNLEKIVIPASVTKIKQFAFRNCKKLAWLVFLGEKMPSHDDFVYWGASINACKQYDVDNWEMADPEIEIFVPNRESSNYDQYMPDMFGINNVTIVHGLEKMFNPFVYNIGGNYQRVTIYDRSSMGFMVKIEITGYDSNTEDYLCMYYGAQETVEEKTLTVPERVLDYKVTGFGSAGKMPNLESAVVPGTCKTIGYLRYIYHDYLPGYNAGFTGCTNLKEVEIQEGVETIYGGFIGTALKELHLPKSLKEYMSNSVGGCQNLTDVYLPVTEVKFNISYNEELDWEGYVLNTDYYYSNSQATLHVPFGAAQNYTDWIPQEFAKIEEMAPQDGDIFAYPFKTGHDMMFQIISEADKTCRVYGQDLFNPSINTNTEGTVNIPAKPLGYTVVEVGNTAFTMCKKLSFVGIPNTVERIGYWALAGCNEMVSANIPASVKVIDEYAFQSNEKLVNVFLPEGLEKIMDHGFAFCPALETITLPQSLTYLGNYAFQGSVLTSIEIPAGIKRIHEYSFQDCKKLESVVLNEGVQEIRPSAFEGCESLTSIDLPRSVNKLYQQAFKNCLKLADVKIRNSQITLVDYWGTPVADNQAFDLKTDRYAELTVPKDTYETYNQDPWFLWFNKISYSLENIPTGISLPATPSSLPAAWYTLDGRQLQQAPTRPGLYIQNGKKTIVR